MSILADFGHQFRLSSEVTASMISSSDFVRNSFGWSLQGDSGGRVPRFVDLDLGSSPGWWAATVATYCPSRMVEHPKSKSTQPRYSTTRVTLYAHIVWRRRRRRRRQSSWRTQHSRPLRNMRSWRQWLHGGSMITLIWIKTQKELTLTMLL